MSAGELVSLCDYRAAREAKARARRENFARCVEMAQARATASLSFSSWREAPDGEPVERMHPEPAAVIRPFPVEVLPAHASEAKAKPIEGRLSQRGNWWIAAAGLHVVIVPASGDRWRLRVTRGDQVRWERVAWPELASAKRAAEALIRRGQRRL